MKDSVLFGVQGSGKGTQAHLLVKKFGTGYSAFEAGELFRALRSTPNSIGTYLTERLDKGLLVDDAVTDSLFDLFYATLGHDQAMILDGFPRKILQMHLLLNKLFKYKRNFLWVLFDLPLESAIERLWSRRVCKSCRQIFSTAVIGENKVCPQCGGELYKRNDDEPEAIKKRIQLFNQETQPVIDYFRSIDKLVVINADQLEVAIFQELLRVVY